MSAIAKGPKNGSRKPKVVRTMVSTSSAVATPSSTRPTASLSSTYCSRLRTKPVTSATSALELAGPASSPSPPAHGVVGSRVRDELDAGDERGRVAEVHAEEPLGVGHSRPKTPIGKVEVLLPIIASGEPPP